MKNKYLLLEELENLVSYKILRLNKQSLNSRKNFSNTQSTNLFFDENFILESDNLSYCYLLLDGVIELETLSDNINLLKNQYNFPKGLIKQKSNLKSKEEDFNKSHIDLFSESKDDDKGDLINDRKNSLTFLHLRNAFFSFLKSDLLKLQSADSNCKLNFNSLNKLIQLIKKNDYLILNLLLLVIREDLIDIKEKKFNINHSLKRFLSESSKYLKNKNISLTLEFKNSLGIYLKNKKIKELLIDSDNLIDQFFIAVILFYDTHEKLIEKKFDERSRKYDDLKSKINENISIFFQFMIESLNSSSFNSVLSNQVFYLNKLAFYLAYEIDREDENFIKLEKTFIDLNSIELNRDEIVEKYEKTIKDREHQVKELKIIFTSEEITKYLKKRNRKSYLLSKVENINNDNIIRIIARLSEVFEKNIYLKKIYLIDEVSSKIDDIYSLEFRNIKEDMISLIKKEFNVEVIYISKVSSTKESEITRIIENSAESLKLEDFLIDENLITEIRYLPAILSAIPINTKSKYFYFEENKLFEYLTFESIV